MVCVPPHDCVWIRSPYDTSTVYHTDSTAPYLFLPWEKCLGRSVDSKYNTMIALANMTRMSHLPFKVTVDMNETIPTCTVERCDCSV